MNTANRAQFADDGRYITDCGPLCPDCLEQGYNTISGQTMWLFMVHPGQMSLAQCATGHHFIPFQAPGVAGETEPGEWPDVREVRKAFEHSIQYAKACAEADL